MPLQEHQHVIEIGIEGREYSKHIALLILQLVLHKGIAIFVLRWYSTAKTQYRKFETNISRKGIAQPQSQFLHSCVCKRFILYVNPDERSACSVAGKYVDDPGNLYGTVKIAHRHIYVEIGTEAAQFLFLEYINGIFVAVCIKSRIIIWKRYSIHLSVGFCLFCVGHGQNAPIMRRIFIVDLLG